MAIQPDSVYSIKEASSILGVNTRKLARIGLKHDIKKVDNRYIFEGRFLIVYFNLDVKTPMAKSVLGLSKDVLKVSKISDAQLDLEVESLKVEIDKAEYRNTLYEKRIKEVNERLRSSDEVILGLRNELSKYKIASNERIEVFTNDEYELLEIRLREWHEQEQKLKHQEQLFSVEKLSLKEMLTHYKKQFKYQKKQSERILQMHQKLIDTIDQQNKILIQRQIIEASDKSIIDQDLKYSEADTGNVTKEQYEKFAKSWKQYNKNRKQ